jgi:SHS2 domain-containing protein
VKPARGHDTIDHTADMGISGWGPAVEQAFEETALAMFELMIDCNGLEPNVELAIEAEGKTLTELLVEFLNRFLRDADIEGVAFLSVGVDSITERSGSFRLEGRARGISREEARDRLLVEVKAATYYGASVKEDEKGFWVARCVVDL